MTEETPDEATPVIPTLNIDPDVGPGDILNSVHIGLTSRQYDAMTTIEGMKEHAFGSAVRNTLDNLTAMADARFPAVTPATRLAWLSAVTHAASAVFSAMSVKAEDSGGLEIAEIAQRMGGFQS